MRLVSFLLAAVASLLVLTSEANAQRRGGRVEQLNINSGGANVSVNRQFGLFGGLRREQIQVNNNFGFVQAQNFKVRQFNAAPLQVRNINVNTYYQPAAVEIRQIKQLRVQPVYAAPQQVIVKQRLQLNQLNTYSAPALTATNIRPIIRTEYVQVPVQVQAVEQYVPQPVTSCVGSCPAQLNVITPPQYYYSAPLVAPIIQYQRRQFIRNCY